MHTVNLRIFDGTSPLVEIDVNYKGRVACGIDEADNRVNVCFTSSVSLGDGVFRLVLNFVRYHSI